MDTIITIAKLIATLVDHQVAPDEDYTSAAGKDFGYVAAWQLPDGGYAVQYGNNGSTDYAIADDADDLACWLESPDLDGLDAIIQTANVRGADDVDEADEDADGPFHILATRDWYGHTETSRFVADGRGNPIEFSDRDEAQRWIDDAEDGVHTLSHNESGATSYKIVSV